MIQRSVVLRAFENALSTWILVLLLATQCCALSHGPGYKDHGRGWKMGACPSMEWQSPINIDSRLANQPEGQFEYHYPIANAAEVFRSDGAVQVDLRIIKGQLRYEGVVYNLQHAIWHSEAEHVVDGMRYPLELQLVHARPLHPKSLLIVSVLFEVKGGALILSSEKTASPNDGDADFNPAVAQVWDAVEDSSLTVDNFDISSLLGTGTGFVEYFGSLTVPPCLQGVTWLVKRNIVPLGKTQVEAFAQTLHKMNNGNGNFRTVQTFNDRRFRLLQGEKSDSAFKYGPREPLALGPNPRTDGEFHVWGYVRKAIRAEKDTQKFLDKFREHLSQETLAQDQAKAEEMEST